MQAINQMIKAVARNRGVRQDIVEKDYAISYLLAAINTVDDLGSNLVLKGGTALKKLYFPNYRFSEDLDYSTRIPGPIQQIDPLMESAVRSMSQYLNQLGPFQIVLEPLVLKLAHPGGQKAYTVRVQFPEQRQPLCRLKVEITVDEPILLPTQNCLILHGFTETFQVKIPAYSLEEITVEKLRTLLQSKVRLQERGWGASRVCRDYYDLWNLLQHPGIKSPALIPLLEQKCAVRNVSFQSANDFVSDDLFAVAKSEWQQQLLPFVPDAPLVTKLLTEVKTFILSIWE
jgi:predicted nucleotidyltransferase component of viral defense system